MMRMQTLLLAVSPFLAALAFSTFALTDLALVSPSFAQTAKTAQRPPPAVVVERVTVQDVSNPVEFTARVEAIDEVDIRARLQGFLRKVSFEGGQAVKAGDTLFEIEPDQFQVAVDSATAQLMRAQATEKSANITLNRNRQLVQKSAVSQATFDDSQAAVDVATADVEIAKAGLQAAQLNLSYASIKSPISGRISKPVVTVGNLVGPDSGSLARVISLDPIRVAFSMTEALLVTLRQEASGSHAVDPKNLDLTLKLANDTIYNQTGRIDYVANEIDPQTGTATVRAIFANPEEILIPGQFVTLSVREKNPPRLPVVSQTAVLQDQQGRYVFVLGDKDVVKIARIETGAHIANGWAVSKGLSGNELVVVQGIQRLADGMTVKPTEQKPAGNGS